MTGKTATDLGFSCECGALRGHITAAGVKSGTRVVCFCHDCRASQIYFGQPDPAPGPVNIFQMSPEAIEIEAGKDNLAAMRLSPNGMYRWYASCCNAPIATTTRSPKHPFAGFDVNRIAKPDNLGPVTTRGFVPQENGKQKHEKVRYAAVGLIKRVISSRLSGSWRKTPFFDAQTSEPVTQPKILTKEERGRLYD